MFMKCIMDFQKSHSQNKIKIKKVTIKKLKRTTKTFVKKIAKREKNYDNSAN